MIQGRCVKIFARASPGRFATLDAQDHSIMSTQTFLEQNKKQLNAGFLYQKNPAML